MVIQRKIGPAAAPPSPGDIARLPGAATTAAVPEPAGPSPARPPLARPLPPEPAAVPLPPDPGVVLPLPDRAAVMLPPEPAVVLPQPEPAAASRPPIVPPDLLPLAEPDPPGASSIAGSGAARSVRSPDPGRVVDRPVVVAAAVRPPVGGAGAELPVVVPQGAIERTRGTGSERRSALGDGGGLALVLGRPVVHARSDRATAGGAPSRAHGNGHGVLPVVASPVEGGWPLAPPTSVPVPLPLASPPAAHAAVVPAHDRVAAANGHRRDPAVVVPPGAPARPTIVRPEQRVPVREERIQRDEHDERDRRVDVDRIADQVHKRFLRQLAVEAERRGTWRVRR
jgi:hypothetical protein